MDMLHHHSLPAAQPAAVDGRHRCGACGGTSIIELYNCSSVPTNSCILLPSEAQALGCARGDIQLGCCCDCGYVGNLAFDPSLTRYTDQYEETQGFSARFRAYQLASAERLVERYGLRDKHITEIGCGKGEFLSLLCELGGNRGTGFDPAYIPARNRSPAASRLSFVRDFFDERHSLADTDAVICRMTLEHIPEPERFIALLRRSLGERRDVLVYFTVPNVLRILEHCCLEDVYYEHCGYFSPGSLTRLFTRCGFSVVDLRTTYDGQYIGIDCRPGDGAPATVPALADDLYRLRQAAERFARETDARSRRWQAHLDQLLANGRRVVLWGSGSKAVSFLNRHGIGSERIAQVVDINPHRHGHYMPGTGQRIIGPDALRAAPPDDVIVMNRIYLEEVRQALSARGLAPRVAAL